MHIERLVGEDDHRHDDQRVQQGNLGIEHCVAHRRPQRDDEEELDG